MATATGQFESNAAVSCGLPSPAGIKPHLFVQKPENFIKVGRQLVLVLFLAG
jgi:hypothetical protein